MERGIPLLTVAIPACNGAGHLAETLRSILSQECEPFDLLVSDDCSDDGTVALVRDLARDRAQVAVQSTRLGLAGNWNHCVALSRTPWVSLFHQDDVMLPGHLAWVSAKISEIALRQDPPGLIAGRAGVIDEASHPVSPSVIDPGGAITQGPPPVGAFLEFSPGEFCSELSTTNSLRCSAVITSRAAHTALGGFDPSYRYVVDWEFWYRVAQNWGVCWRTEEPTVLVRWHHGSETHRFKAGIEDLEEESRFFRQVIEPDHSDSPDQDPIRSAWQKGLARAYLNRAQDALRNSHLALARTCLRRAWSLSPRRVAKTFAADPRLCAQMATLAATPRLARRWFADKQPIEGSSSLVRRLTNRP